MQSPKADNKDIKNTDIQENDIFEKLYHEIQAKKGTFSSSYFYFKDDKSAKPPTLIQILAIDEKALSTIAKETLELFEKESSEDAGIAYTDFKWNVLSFVTIQDIFDAAIFDETALKNMFQQWYFYYESKYILTELILCWLNGFYNAENSLLRSFLEFNLLQLYFYRTTKKNSSYGALNEYFKKRITPGWGKLVNKSIPSDKFSRPIAMRLKSALDGLSQHAVHPYHPESSYKQYGNMSPGPCLEGMYFWVTIQLILQPVLWAYYVNFPMLFKPVDLIKKFGFNGPVGVFIDNHQNIPIRSSLDNDSYKEFENYANSQEDVKSLLSWYDSHDDLTDVKIWDTWDSEHDKKPESIQHGCCVKIAKLRAMREVMSLERHDDILPHHEQTDARVKRLTTYCGWKTLLSNSKNRKPLTAKL